MLISILPKHLTASWTLALAIVAPVWAADAQPKRDRYMVTLKEHTPSVTVSKLSSELASVYGFKVITTFTRGALVGIVAELDPEKIVALGQHEAVGRVQKIGPPGPPPPGEEGNKFFRSPPGWAMPGVYEVMLADDATDIDFSTVPRPDGLVDPDWEAKDAAKIAAVQELADELVSSQGARLLSTFAPTVPGFACAMNERQAVRMAADRRVKYVSESVYTLLEFESVAPVLAPIPDSPPELQPEAPTAACNSATMQSWNLDRINSRPNDCDGQLASGAADGVHVYVVDTGIKATHSQFGGRVRDGHSIFAPLSPYEDCIGHGTGVAAVVGGATFGVAKNVILHPVRVDDCSPDAPPNDAIAGFNWVRNKVLQERSLGIMYPTIVVFAGAYPITHPDMAAIELAVQNLINDAQVLVVSVGGNHGGDAGQITPGRHSWVVQSGATRSNDSRASFSGYGSSLDLFAPGHDIVTAHPGGSVLVQGTSVAAPLVAGVASLARERAPWQRWIDIKLHLEGAGTPNVVTNQGSFNTRLLYTDPPPAAPNQVQLRRISSTAIDITWRDNAANEAGYVISRRRTDQNSFVPIMEDGPVAGSGNVVGWVDNDAPALTEGEVPTAFYYEYRVQAQAAVISAGYAPLALSQNIPTAATNTEATALSSTRIRVRWWDNSTNETGFKIERAQGSGSFSVIADLTPGMAGTGQREYIDNGVGHGQTYHYRVLAYSASGNSGYSDTDSASTPIVYVRFQYQNTDVAEGAQAQADLQLEIVPNLPLTSPVTVNYATYDEHPNGLWAQAGVDYSQRSGTATFPPGSGSGALVTVPGQAINTGDNATPEPIEYFHLTLGNPPNGAVFHPLWVPYWKHVFFIVDDDTHVSVNDAPTVEEVGPDPLDMVFTVTLDRPFGRPILVGYQTASGTATVGQDYVAQSGTLTFAENETSKAIRVDMLNDNLDEEEYESIYLNLGSPLEYVTIGDGQGVGLIHDEDPPPTMTVHDGHVPEGNSGITHLPIEVTLSGPSALPIQVSYQTADLGATAGSDYTAVSGTLSFAPAIGSTPGDTTKTILVPVIGDTAVEPAESFRMVFSGVQNALLPDNEALGTIDPDGDIASISAADVSVTEIDDPAATVDVTVTVSLSVTHYQTVTVAYNTLPGTAGSPDFIATSGTLTYAPGQTSKSFVVKVKGDPNDEHDETFTANLSQALPAGTTQIVHHGVVTILDNDPAPNIILFEGTVTEGTCGTSLLSSSATISPPSGKTIAWLYETLDGAARAGEDYNAFSQSMNVTPGVSSVPLGVTVLGDRVDEGHEHLYARLSGVTNANVTSAQVLLMIWDDDTAPGLTGNDIGHGLDLVRTIRPVTTPEWFAVAEKARTSYEVVVESASGLLGVPGSPVKLDLMSCEQTNVHVASQAVGSGDARSLRWETVGPSPEDRQDRLVRVTTGCTTGCLGSGTYRLRAYDTTYSIPRFNNAGQQQTFVFLQNPTSYSIDVSLHFWHDSGSFLWTQAQTIAPRSSVAIDTRSVPLVNGQSGSITVSNTGRYGDLVGSAITVDTGMQMTYDTPMVAKPK